MEMKELVRLARMKASGTIPDESRQSLPIPVRRNGRLYVSFLFVPTVKKPGAPVQLGAPDYIATLRISDGRLESLQSLEADPAGGPPDRIIGTFGLPDNMTAEEYVKRQAELFAAYDVLLPLFAQPEEPVGQNGRDWSRYFLDLFQAVSEPPLRPYYESFGAEFFRWVSQAAQR